MTNNLRWSSWILWYCLRHLQGRLIAGCVRWLSLCSMADQLWVPQPPSLSSLLPLSLMSRLSSPCYVLSWYSPSQAWEIQHVTIQCMHVSTFGENKSSCGTLIKRTSRMSFMTMNEFKALVSYTHDVLIRYALRFHSLVRNLI